MPMVSKKLNQSLLSKVAQMYYEQELSQQEIAERLRTSRPTISRMLEQARSTGIVTITVKAFNDHITRLEKELEKTFNLNEVAVLSLSSVGDSDEKKALGEAAANILQRIVRSSDVIGISWGTSLRETVDALSPQIIPGLTAVPLVGGMGQEFRYEIHSNSLVVDLARKFSGKSCVLHAPAIVATEELKKAILEDPESRSIMDMAKKANIALVGLGALNEFATMIKTGFFSMQDFEEIARRGGVGEICSVFFDRNGSDCEIDINKRVIGIGPKELKEIETVIAIVAGVKKEEALHAALRGQFINVLVTDEQTAEKVLLIESVTK
jgi:deoxyribonucleoside regulator